MKNLYKIVDYHLRWVLNSAKKFLKHIILIIMPTKQIHFDSLLPSIPLHLVSPLDGIQYLDRVDEYKFLLSNI